MSAQQVDVLAAMKEAAEDVASGDVGLRLLRVAEAVAALVREVDLIADALAQDGRTPAGMTKDVAAKRLRAALRPFTGGEQG